MGFLRLKGLIFFPDTAPLLPMGCGGYCSFSPFEVIEAELQYQMQPVYSWGAVSILEAPL